MAIEPVVFAENSLTPKLQYIENMLTGSSTDDERMIMDNKALLEKLPKPAKGEKNAARKANDEALMLIKAKAFEQAVPLLAKAHQLDPLDIEVLNNYGFVLTKSRNLDNAYLTLADALAMKPDRASGWSNIADVLALQGKMDSAVAGYMNAYRFSKNREKTHQLFQNTQLIEDSPYVHEAVKKATEKAARLFFQSPSENNLVAQNPAPDLQSKQQAEQQKKDIENAQAESSKAGLFKGSETNYAETKNGEPKQQDRVESFNVLVNPPEKPNAPETKEITKEEFLSAVESIDRPLCGSGDCFSYRDFLEFDEITTKFIPNRTPPSQSHDWIMQSMIEKEFGKDFDRNSSWCNTDGIHRLIEPVMSSLRQIRWFQSESYKNALPDQMNELLMLCEDYHGEGGNRNVVVKIKEFLAEYDAALQRSVPKLLALQQVEIDTRKQKQDEEIALKKREETAEIMRKETEDAAKIAREESEKVAEIARKQREQEAAIARNRMIEQHTADLKGGKATPQNVSDAIILLGAKEGPWVVLRPPINPTGEYFALNGVVDGVKNEGEAQIITAKIGDGSYFAIRLSAKTKTLGNNQISLRSPMWAVGRYTENLNYTTVIGQEKFMPLIDADYVQ